MTGTWKYTTRNLANQFGHERLALSRVSANSRLGAPQAAQLSGQLSEDFESGLLQMEAAPRSREARGLNHSRWGWTALGREAEGFADRL
jgi:hypothetical protein